MSTPVEVIARKAAMRPEKGARAVFLGAPRRRDVACRHFNENFIGSWLLAPTKPGSTH